MSLTCRATTPSDDGEARCLLPRGHAGVHVGHDDQGGGIRVWPPAADPAVTQNDVTLDELLAHHDDLAELAAASGFSLYAALLLKWRQVVERDREHFERQPRAVSLRSSRHSS